MSSDVLPSNNTPFFSKSFRYYWVKFVLIHINPTEAAVDALRAVSGNISVLEKLNVYKTRTQLITSELILPLIQLGDTLKERHVPISTLEWPKHFKRNNSQSQISHIMGPGTDTNGTDSIVTRTDLIVCAEDTSMLPSKDENNSFLKMLYHSIDKHMGFFSDFYALNESFFYPIVPSLSAPASVNGSPVPPSSPECPKSHLPSTNGLGNSNSIPVFCEKDVSCSNNDGSSASSSSGVDDNLNRHLKNPTLKSLRSPNSNTDTASESHTEMPKSSTATAEGSNSISDVQPCIDFDQVNHFYSGLCSLLEGNVEGVDGDDVSCRIFKEIEHLADSLQKAVDQNPDALINPEQLRFLLILLEFPFFENYPSSCAALSEVLRLITLLSPGTKQILQKWYERIPLETIRRHVMISEQLITLSILEATSSSHGFQFLRDTVSPTIRHALGFLKILYEANLSRESSPLGSITPDEFYNDAINTTELMTRLDFYQWKKDEKLDFALISHPFILEPATKAWYLLREYSTNQEVESLRSLVIFPGFSLSSPYLIVKVRRNEIVHDTLRRFSAITSQSDLRKPLKVVFDEEDGVDEGGVTKEFFQLLVEELFNPDFGMFEYDDISHLCWFNPSSFESNLQFELIGVLLGLGIYNGVILHVNFPLAVYKKLLGVKVGLKDLAEFKPDVARSLSKLRSMSAKEIDDLALTFTAEINAFGEVTEREFEGHTKDDLVTFDNREEYIDLYVDWILNKSIVQQFEAFNKGFVKCCGDQFLKSLFRAEELQLVICGSTELDLKSLERVTKYQDGYSAENQTIKDFWEIVHTFDENKKKKLLSFVTGSDRVPIKGLSSMQFFIGKNGSAVHKLPTAHTCFNYLLLPNYQDKEKLEKFLMIALDNCRGFGLC